MRAVHVRRSPRSSWPDELLSTAQLWPGDVENEDDAEAISREERTLRSWINSVLHQGSNAHSHGADAHAALSHSCIVDSSLLTGQAPGQGLRAVAHGPLRLQSLGGAIVAAANRPSALQGAAASRGVLRSSSAGAAAVAAHLDGEGTSTGVTHSRSISADASNAGTEDSVISWAGVPAVPSTPTAAAAAAAAQSPLTGAAGASSGAASVAAGEPTISSVSSLFGAELRSGVLLLEILELLQPGCVDWRLANRPPFVSRTAQLKALENCQLALKVAQVRHASNSQP
jgi:hypothetical protein